MKEVWKIRRNNRVNHRGFRRAEGDKNVSRDEVRSLLEATKPRKDPIAETAYDIFIVAANLGLRSIEITWMQKPDFEYLHHHYLIVHTAKKGREKEDRLYVGRDEEKMLHDIFRRRAKWSGSRLFPIATRAIRHYWAYFANIARIHPRVTFHSLRHFAACEIERAGGDMKYAMTRLRHEKPKAFATFIYRHATPDEMIEAANRKGVVV